MLILFIIPPRCKEWMLLLSVSGQSRILQLEPHPLMCSHDIIAIERVDINQHPPMATNGELAATKIPLYSVHVPPEIKTSCAASQRLNHTPTDKIP